jgi:hypothetical protein
MENGAIFSEDKRFRYSLWRIWNDKKPLIMFIGLNPSIANDESNDRTVSKLIKYTEAWGFGGFYICNLFAFITPYPKELKKAESPTGEKNNHYLLETATKCEKIVCMWGNHGSFKERDKEVTAMFSKMHCLDKTKSGQPKHPLYLSAHLKPIEFI